MSKPLKIPPSRKHPGLFVHCSACDALVTDVCKKHNQPIEKCKEGKTRYKAIIHVPGTKKKTRALTLETRDYDQAVQQTIAFKTKVHDDSTPNAARVAPEFSRQKSNPTTQEKPTHSLLSLMTRFVGVLHDDPELVPVFKRRNLSKAHVQDCERSYLRFVVALKNHGCSVEHLLPHDVDDTLVGVFYDHLLTDLKLGNAGFNRAITNMVSLWNYLIEEGYATKNPFEGVTRKATQKNIDTIDEKDFHSLVELMRKPELGVHTYTNGIRKSMWRSYAAEAVELILYAGRRRTECVLMRWEDIQYENGQAISIRVPDYKINKAKNIAQDQWIYHFVPVNDELRNLLARMNEATYRGSSAYIIAPEEHDLSREGIASLLSKSFSHYYEILHPESEKKLSLGCLRRTNFSQLSAAIGVDNAQLISGHAGTGATLKRHYVSKKVLAQAATFNVFDPKGKEEREEKLRKARESDQDMTRSRE